MIRREIQLPGEEPQWLLISQVEHARISGVLAEHCLSHLPEVVRSELVQAIIHHDDGWAKWEECPQLDADGCPLSFRELELEESLPIWTTSIEAAAEIGPLARWCVAGHFLALLQSSDKSIPSFAAEWQDNWVSAQSQLLAVWQAMNPARHTKAVANEALRWLQLLDVMSLWICSACPSLDEQDFQMPPGYHVGQGENLETHFSFQHSRPSIDPWRFDVPTLQLSAEGWIVPVRKYADVDELLHARSSQTIEWLLGP